MADLDRLMQEFEAAQKAAHHSPAARYEFEVKCLFHLQPLLAAFEAERERLRAALERIARLTVVKESHADCANAAVLAVSIAKDTLGLK